MIRKATLEDMTAIVEMSDKFYQTTHYADSMPMDPVAVGMLVHSLTEHSIMLIAEEADKIVGMLGIAVIPFIFNPAYSQAHEIVWWVDPEYQSSGVGQELLKAGPAACGEFENVVRIQMVSLPNSPPQVAKLYERLGYFHSETMYTKVI